MSFADVNHFDARHCIFQNAGRNLVNITLQVLPPSPLSTESHSQRLTDAITLSSVQNNREPLIALAHSHPSSLHLIAAIAPLLDLIIHRRDFLRDLPSALALRIIGFVDDPRTIVRMSQVNKHWRSLLSDKRIWRMMCSTFGFDADLVEAAAYALVGDEGASDQPNNYANPALKWLVTLTILPTSAQHPRASPPFDHVETTFSYRKYIKSYYDTSVSSWRGTARLVCPCLSVASLAGSTSTAVPEEDWVVLSSPKNGDHEIGLS